MPQLQFDITGPLAAADKRAFAAEITEHYTAEMATTAGHVAVSIREREAADLHLGRAVEGRRLLLDADIRQGRDQTRKRSFAVAAMDCAHERWGIPRPNMKVVFTEHAGPEMMGYNRVGEAWSEEERTT